MLENAIEEIEKYRHNRKTAHVVMWICLVLTIATVPALLLLSPSVGPLPCVLSATILVLAILASEGLGLYFKEKAEQLEEVMAWQISR